MQFAGDYAGSSTGTLIVTNDDETFRFRPTAGDNEASCIPQPSAPAPLNQRDVGQARSRASVQSNSQLLRSVSFGECKYRHHNRSSSKLRHYRGTWRGQLDPRGLMPRSIPLLGRSSAFPANSFAVPPEMECFIIWVSFSFTKTREKLLARCSIKVNARVLSPLLKPSPALNLSLDIHPLTDMQNLNSGSRVPRAKIKHASRGMKKLRIRK